MTDKNICFNDDKGISSSEESLRRTIESLYGVVEFVDMQGSKLSDDERQIMVDNFLGHQKIGKKAS